MTVPRNLATVLLGILFISVGIAAQQSTRGENGLCYPLSDMRMRPKSMGLQTYVGMLYGDKLRTADGIEKPHQGWDLIAPVGTPAYAIGDGTVMHVQQNHAQYGKQVIVSFVFSGDTRYAQYAHLSDIEVVAGDVVKKGQQIGASGTTGNADNKYPHLHFEVRTIGDLQVGVGLSNRIDPREVFPKMYKSYEDYAKRRTGTPD